mmetsp:Transcript_5646/g.17868  ORF Transcript_5646/g.17868 Transcript_5646/m.17868 type:complete len:234 (-) Transcript_5646:22-723(-)
MALLPRMILGGHVDVAAAPLLAIVVVVFEARQQVGFEIQATAGDVEPDPLGVAELFLEPFEESEQREMKNHELQRNLDARRHVGELGDEEAARKTRGRERGRRRGGHRDREREQDAVDRQRRRQPPRVRLGRLRQQRRQQIRPRLVGPHRLGQDLGVQDFPQLQHGHRHHEHERDTQHPPRHRDPQPPAAQFPHGRRDPPRRPRRGFILVLLLRSSFDAAFFGGGVVVVGVDG